MRKHKKNLLTRKYLKLTLISILSLCTLLIGGCQETKQAQQPEAQLYLYGEQHGEEIILQKELELWQNYYTENNMRHLFVELPSYTADFLNIWLHSDNDEIFEQLFDDWQGTAIYNNKVKEFYQQIKATCPETIFHGVDVGHQWETTGQRYLQYCQDNGLADSEAYSLAQACINQGQRFYENHDWAYREQMLTENFSQAFDALENESIMGIFGAAHTAPETEATMAANLHALYSAQLHCEDLTYLLLLSEPQRYDTFSVNGKDYQAAYFGSQDLSSWGLDFISRDFWRLEQAYADFKDNPTSGDVLPYDNYPMQIETEQVFLIVYTKPDQSSEKHYFRADGNSWQGRPATEEFIID